MKVNANTLRSGNVIDYNDKLWVVIKNDIQQPGKGASVAQVEIRDIRSGNKDNVRFRTQETVTRVRLEQDDYQYLYDDEDRCVFMHTENYEQKTVTRELIGDQGAFLTEGMIVELETYEGEALGVKLPDTVTVKVIEAEPVIKGQTATTSYKPAVVEGGVPVQVPPHIDVDTVIIVRTEDGSYAGKA